MRLSTSSPRRIRAKAGLNAEETDREADAYSVCVYSRSQEDGKPNGDTYVSDVREDLEHYYLDKKAEINAKSAFKS